jgi:ABC-type dipeptide/oligopeptide/nickel transport system permease subunit
MIEAALSFLGRGVQPPAPSWGTMLSAARNFMELRDVLDPRLRGT